MKIQRTSILAIVVLFVLLARGDMERIIVPKAQPFPLQQVRLLDGPFRDAMVRDENYLLSLDCDRLLYNFRVNAQLPAEARPYGGWEAPACELRGHSVGHYLSACSLMFASTGDARFKERVDKIVAGFAECQNALATNGSHAGYLSAFPESFIDRVENRKPVWAPWYTLHKIMAGLLDANQLGGNAQALEVLTNMANWVKFRVDHLPEAKMQASLGTEFGGMNEVLANLYGVTGNADYLKTAEAFNQKTIFDPLAQGQDKLNGLHANTQIPKMIGAARQYELTGDARDADIAKFFWECVALHRSYVIGGHSDREHFFPTNDFAKHLSVETAETCNTYNMLKLTRHLFAWQPDATMMDFYERALYNDILASQDPDTGMFTYFMSLKPGHFKTYSQPDISFWCCVGTGMENHAKYGDTIYFHGDNSLFVNLFIPSELSWPEKNLVVRQETKFPESDKTILVIGTVDQTPVRFALKIRWPVWAEKISVRVNGEKQKISGKPGSYVTIDRAWEDGAGVEIQLPMKLHTEPLPGSTNIVAVLYGPIVLAGNLGTNGMSNPCTRDQLDLAKIPDPKVPVFVGDPKTILKKIKPAGEPLVFQTKHLGQPNDVTLVPFYRANRERYSVYWNVVSEAEWKSHPAQNAAAGGQLLQAALNEN
ncbi:MAG: beta-L-arabinofuranosidase domain-containing protein [Limisphaerales bacterium]